MGASFLNLLIQLRNTVRKKQQPTSVPAKVSSKGFSLSPGISVYTAVLNQEHLTVPTGTSPQVILCT